MKFTKSTRFILIVIFIITIFTPVMIIMTVVPRFYRDEMIEDTHMLINNNLESISNNISSYLMDLQRLVTFPYFDKEVMSALKAKANIENEKKSLEENSDINRILKKILPNYLKISRKEFLSTIIINGDGSTLSWNRNQNVHLKENYNFLSQYWYNQAIQADGKPIFVGIHQPIYFSNSQNYRVFSIAKMIKDPYADKSLGVIFIDADTIIFEDIFKDLNFNVDSISLLLDEDGNLLYSSRPISDHMLNKLNNKASSIIENNEHFIANYKIVVPSKWTIGILLSDTQMQIKIRWIYIIGIIASIIALIVTFFIFQLLSKYYIVHPIKEMSKVMKEVEKGNLKARFISKKNNEISKLGYNLNRMIIKLNNLITKEYKLVLNQRNAEYRALQSQIQPHFLYNTLNGFLGLNRMGKNKILENSILNLTGMLRYTLNPKNITTIEEEFKFLEKYCSLQKLRFEDKMIVDIQYEKEVSDFEIPKLLIQPLVENAIIYCVEPSTQVCHIEVTAKKQFFEKKQFIVISIKDDGMGFDTNALKSPESIGLHNTKERLKLSYPKSSFHIFSKPNEGTSIIIQIPFS